jgi:general stress protein YciG
MADSNPANFANLSKERVQEIAAMGGKASHGTNGNANGDTNAEELDKVGRNPDGTFKPNSEAASEAGKKGGHCSHENDGKEENEDNGRDAEGKFLPGSAAAKEGRHCSRSRFDFCSS